MDRESLISVVMPAHNAEATIGEAVRSVLCQTHRNLELVIVDDASTDRTLAVARELAQGDARARVLSNGRNQGVAWTRNHGVAQSRGAWVAFLDSDDIWSADKLEKQLRTMEGHPTCSLCFTGSSFIDEKGAPSSYVLSVPEKITYQELLKQNLISCSSVLVRSDALRRHPMIEDPRIHEDYATWLSILRHEPYAVGVDEPLLTYRVAAGSKSGNKARAARMQLRTYRAAGVSPARVARSFVAYAWRNMGKYLRIRGGMAREARR